MAWKLLFSSDFGVLSLIVILFMLVMAGYYGWYFSKKMKEDEKEAGK